MYDYGKYNNCLLYINIFKKYSVNESFKITPLKKLDVNLSQYFFKIDTKNYKIIRNFDTIRLFDSEDDYSVTDSNIPNDAVYDSCENVLCIYKYHIDENDEKYEYYKQIFIDNLIYNLKYKLKDAGLVNKIEIKKYIKEYKPETVKGGGLIQLIEYGSQDKIFNKLIKNN